MLYEILILGLIAVFIIGLMDANEHKIEPWPDRPVFRETIYWDKEAQCYASEWERIK